MSTDVVVAGNVVEDRTAEGGWAPGGPSLYSARMAQRLGARVTLITCEPASAGPGSFDRTSLQGLTVVELPRLKGKPMPRYANTYSEEGDRTQLLVEPGDALPITLIQSADPPRFVSPVDVLMYAPAFHELRHPPDRAIPARVAAISLQGLLRSVDANMVVSPHPRPGAQVEPWVPAVQFAFLSEEDTPGAEPLGRALAGAGVNVFVTRGYRGAILFTPGNERNYEAMPASATEPTGAGDCFSMSFLVRYAESGDLDEAARFALAAGSLAVEGPGLEAVPTRAQVEQRLARVAA